MCAKLAFKAHYFRGAPTDGSAFEVELNASDQVFRIGFF
jgi:hypothetical protein